MKKDLILFKQFVYGTENSSMYKTKLSESYELRLAEENP